MLQKLMIRYNHQNRLFPHLIYPEGR